MLVGLRLCFSPRGLLLGFVLLALASCEYSPPPSGLEPVICPTGMDLSKAEVNLPMGRQVIVGVVGGHDRCPVTWTISDNEIIRGLPSNTHLWVTGLVVGETTIHAYRGRTGGPTSVCSVTVLNNTYSSLNVIQDSLFLNSGTTNNAGRLVLNIYDVEGKLVQPIVPVVWTNSDSSVVDLTGYGITGTEFDRIATIRAVAEGHAVITATYNGPGTTEKALSDTCLVTVTPAGGS